MQCKCFAALALLARTSVIVSLIFAALDASAASRWHTARTINQQTQPISAGTETTLAPDGRRMSVSAATVTNGLIDIVVSLYNNPQGDDDGNTQDADPASVEQDNYERIIQFFADGVYESTEGVHSLRNVRIYRNASRQDADVIWEETGGPRAGFMNQNGIAAHISMFNHFSGAVFTNASDHEPGGYILAHELGHYFYGLLDEYCRWDGGTYGSGGAWANLRAEEKTRPAIMNHQWSAANRRYQWLNHSIRADTNTAGFIPFECRPRTAQYQFYGDGAWPVLVRNPDNDPLDNANRRGLRERWGKRMYYPELAAVAPTGTNPPGITLSRATPLQDLASRQHLNIIWMSSNIVLMIALDKSGSMERYHRLENAKTAAKLLVDQLPDGSAVGVVAFNEEVEIVRDLTVLNTPAQRTAVNNAIDGITPEGWTAIGDAATAALERIKGYGRENWLRVMFLLTDGQSNVGTDPLSVVAEFQNEQVPVMAFGFGNETEIDTRLPEMASLTGGRYHYSPDSLVEITAAFQNAMTEIAARHNLADDILPASGAGLRANTINIPFDVDVTIADLRAFVGYTQGEATDIILYDPLGATYPPAATNQNGSDRVLTFTVNNPPPGQWRITGSRTGALRYQINASVNGFTYYLTAESADGETAAFPAPIRINATLTHNTAIAGAIAHATLTDPANNRTRIQLADSGMGIYSGIFIPASNGTHTIMVEADNSAGTAVYTWEDAVYSAMRNGDLPPQQPDEPVNAQFSRAFSFQVTVTGMEQAPVTVPAAPAGVTASQGDYPDYVKISWNAVTNASTYEIWRAADENTRIAVVQNTYTDYMDTAVSTGEAYNYRVKAVNHAGASGFSSAAQGWPLFGPAIRVNELRSLTLGIPNYVEVTALLQTAGMTIPCDWWVAAYAENTGLYYWYDINGQWHPANDLQELRPVYTGTIFDITDPYTILRISNLSAGTYHLYFGLDWTPNGRLDMDTIIYDTAVLRVE